MYSNIYGCKIRAVPEKITTWDKIIINRYRNRVFTIGELLVYLKKKIKYNPDLITCNNLV